MAEATRIKAQIKNPTLSRRVSQSVELWLGYFFLRLSKPAPMEPRPRRPSNGSGEAVCGRLEPAAC